MDDTQHPTASLCANCGAALAGAWCHACGQRAHVHRSLLHFLEELLHGVWHFDAKGWRTLPLLVARPGVLTRRYIDGQRTRYVSPLALFLFCVFLMFFVFSVTGRSPKTPEMLDEADRAEARAELMSELQAARARVAAYGEQAASGAAGAPIKLAAARKRLQIVEATLAAFDGGVQDNPELNSALSKPAVEVETDWPALDKALRQQFQNPELALYKLKTSAYKFSFLLVPISLPFLWLMFVRRRDVVMYDHAVFVLYSLSFMALLLVLVVLIATAWPSGWLAPLLIGVMPLHMFSQLRGTYGLTWGGAAWRTTAMVLVAGVVFTLYLVLITFLSA